MVTCSPAFSTIGVWVGSANEMRALPSSRANVTVPVTGFTAESMTVPRIWATARGVWISRGRPAVRGLTTARADPDSRATISTSSFSRSFSDARPQSWISDFLSTSTEQLERGPVTRLCSGATGVCRVAGAPSTLASPTTALSRASPAAGAAASTKKSNAHTRPGPPAREMSRIRVVGMCVASWLEWNTG